MKPEATVASRFIAGTAPVDLTTRWPTYRLCLAILALVHNVLVFFATNFGAFRVVDGSVCFVYITKIHILQLVLFTFVLCV